MSSRSHHGHGSSSAKISNSILSFFLSLLLCVELVLIVGFVCFFWQPGFASIFDDDYYAYVYDYVNKQALYYTLPTGYDESVVDGVFTLSEVHGDVQGYVSASFKGGNYRIDETDERARINQHLSELYRRDGKEFDAEARSYADAYADELMAVYRKGIELPALDAFALVRARLVTVVLIAIVAIALLCVALIASLLSSHHYRHRGMRYVAYATGGAFLLGTVGPAAVYLSGFYKGLNVTPQFFYHFCVSMIERVIFLCLIGSCIYLVLTFVLIARVAKRRSRLVKH